MVRSKKGFKSARVRAGLSMNALARAASVSAPTVFKAEHGRPITPATARKLREALGADFDDLFMVEEEM